MPDAARMPAVLLGGAMNALSVGRSLWKMGVAVDVFDDGAANSPARHSRSVRRFVALRGDDPVSDQWRGQLIDEWEPSVVLACCDDGVEFIARHRAELEAVGHRPVEANDDVNLALLDKGRTYALAREVGVAAPKTMTLASHTDLAEVADFLYPCAIKPINSHVFSRQFRPAAKGAYVDSHPEVVELVTPLIDQGIPMLLTEVVEGSDECCSYYSYLDADGTPLTHFTKRKLRQYPIRFGSGTYHMTKWNPEVAELGLRFFEGIGLRGLGMVEFKRDARDGALKLIESNPRFSLANELVRAAGIDFGRLAYNRLVGLPLPPLDSFRDDLALCLVIDDLRACREYYRDGELTPQTWAKSLLHRQCAAEFDWKDPGPSLANVGSRAANLVRRVGPGPDTGQSARRRAGPYATR